MRRTKRNRSLSTSTIAKTSLCKNYVRGVYNSVKDEIDEHEYFLKFEAEKAQKAELAEEEGEEK